MMLLLLVAKMICIENSWFITEHCMLHVNVNINNSFFVFPEGEGGLAHDLAHAWRSVVGWLEFGEDVYDTTDG